MKSHHRKVVCRILIHFTLLTLAFSYMILGGYMFCQIENRTRGIKPFNLTASINYDKTTSDKSYQTPNVYQNRPTFINEDANRRSVRSSQTLDLDQRPDWTLFDGFLYTYSAVTTIGYGSVVAQTDAGRIFFVFFSIFGIAVFALFINDLGYYLQDLLIWIYYKFNKERRNCDLIVPLTSIILLPVTLFIFLLYLALGGILLPFWEVDWDFIKAFYFSFDAITTVGIGDIYPRSNAIFLPALIYFTFGMAIGCACISFLSDFGRALHFLGSKPENCADEIAWFSGKPMKIGDLVEIVGLEFGATRSEIKSVNASLDRLIRERLRQK